MLFSLRSTALFSALIAASLLVERSFDPAQPVVANDPDELAVPALLVRGGGEATFAEFAGATRIAAGVIETADIGRTGWHSAYASRSCPGRAGIWRAHGAAGARRRPARRSASAATAATATLSQRGDWRNKQRDRDD